ncbi:MAG: TBC domain-containing protein, partial [archaeon]|nr:TBC domain-containing protein [archaeon]
SNEERLKFGFMGIIEKKLKVSESVLCQNIISEYSDLSKTIKRKSSSKSENLDYPNPIYPKVKFFTAETDPQKQKSIMLKWMKQISYESKTLNYSGDFQADIEKSFYQLYSNNPKYFSDLLSESAPRSIRALLWKIIAVNKLNSDLQKFELSYEEYLKIDLPESVENAIIKDLNRTFNSEDNYPKEAKEKLYNLLKAISIQDSEIGYCQGLNFIAANILKVTDFNEVDSFIILSYLMTEIRGYFKDGFPLLTLNLHIFNHFFKKFLPKLYVHFQKLELIDELWITNWLQTIFSVATPFEITCRIWDCLFAYGMDFIIPISIGILSILQKHLLKINDSVEIIEYFKKSFFMKTIKRRLSQPNIMSPSKEEISFEKVVSQAKQVGKSINKEALNKLKEDCKRINEINFDDLYKQYEPDIILTTASSFKSSIISSTSSSPLKAMGEIKKFSSEIEAKELKFSKINRSKSELDDMNNVNIQYEYDNEEIKEEIDFPLDDIDICDEFAEEEEVTKNKMPFYEIQFHKNLNEYK